MAKYFVQAIVASVMISACIAIAGEEADDAAEIIETRAGKTYRGRVVGYESGTRSYVIQVGSERIAVPEADVATVRRLEDPPAPAPAAVAAPPAARGPEVGDDPVSVEWLLRRIRSLPPPARPEAIRALDEAAEKLRSGEPLGAVEPLRRAIEADRESPAAAMLLAAIRLDVEREPEAAFELLAPHAASGPAALKALLARAALSLGHLKLNEALEAEVLAERFEGAERQYRLFRFWAPRDPERARAAWAECRRLDPSWAVAEAEGKLLRQAGADIDDGRPTAAAAALARARSENPLLGDEVRPLLARALLARSDRAKAEGLFEVAAADLRAAAEEAPERSAEIAAKLGEVEAALVGLRIEAAGTREEIERTLAALSREVPGLKDRHATSVGAALAAAARKALDRREIEAADWMAKEAAGWGEKVDPLLIEALRRSVAADRPVDGTAVGRVAVVGVEAARGGDAPEGRGPAGEMPWICLVPGTRWKYLYGDGSREVQVLDRVEAEPGGGAAYRFASELQMGEARIPSLKTGILAGGFFSMTQGRRLAGGDKLIKAGAAPGDSWSWRKGDFVCERQVVATDARVSCRAGTFEDCLEVKATSRFDAGGLKSNPVVQHFYYAKGVGLVKIEADNPLDGRELEEYKIGREGSGAAQAPAPVTVAPAPAAATPGEPLLDGGIGGSPEAGR